MDKRVGISLGNGVQGKETFCNCEKKCERKEVVMENVEMGRHTSLRNRKNWGLGGENWEGN